MAFLSGITDKIREWQGKPPKPKIAEVMQDFTKPKLPAEGMPGMVPLPKGVDLSALWEEPNDPSSLAAILSGIGMVVSVIAVIAILLHK